MKRDRCTDNIMKAMEKVLAAVIVDSKGNNVGVIVHRWTNNAAGRVCHTSLKMWAPDGKHAPVAAYCKAKGCGYDKKGANLCSMFLTYQKEIEGLTGLKYPEDPFGGIQYHMEHHWDQYLRDAGWQVYYAV